MTCADARNLILSADPAALRDRTDPVLRQHLDRCPECSVAIGHVVDDMARLRAALTARAARLPAPRRREPKRVAMSLVPVALAAELALFAFLGTKDTANPLNQRVVIDDTVTSMLPIAHWQMDTAEALVASTPPKVVDEARRPDSASSRDTSSRRRDSVAALLRRLIPTGGQQYAEFELSGSKGGIVWTTRRDTL